MSDEKDFASLSAGIDRTTSESMVGCKGVVLTVELLREMADELARQRLLPPLLMPENYLDEDE